MSEKETAKGGRSGTERAAMLLLTLGEQEAAEVLKHMGAKDVQKVGSAMAQMANVSRDEVSGVLTRFSTVLENQTSLGVGSDDYIRRVMINALGEDKASGVIDRILVGRSSKGLEALKWMEPKAVAEIVRFEHPQIVAIVLSYLDPDQSAGVLSLLPDSVRADVVMRIATLDGIQPSALSELNEIMEKQFAGNGGGTSSGLGGVKVAANIVNLMDMTAGTTLMEQIQKSDEALSTRIQDLMFVFDNLLEIDDRGMQELLRQVQSDRLLLALKGAEEELKEKIFKNMSQRAAEMLKDDLEAKGPVKLSEVEAAQKEVLAVARKMAEAGTLALGGKGGEAYV
ncbi:MAG: flagellar motor switch protein FliG [Steroidobacteraceae bacterium]